MYDAETRHRAVIHYKYFERSLRRVSKHYGVSKSALQRWVSRVKEPTKAGVRRRRRRSRHLQVRSVIDECLTADPFMTLAEMSDFICKAANIALSPRTVCRYLKLLGYSRKKAYRTVKHGPDHTQVVRSFCGSYPNDDGVVSIDEAGFYIGDVGRCGYAPKGKRLNVSTSRTLRRSKLTAIVAIHSRGLVHYKILDHNCRKADFVSFVKELPERCGTAAVLDNISFHHSKETVQAFRDIGVNPVYTPPYSPEFNAIECLFGPAKRAYRRACPLTVPGQNGFDYKHALIGVMESFRATDLTAYFNHVSKTIKKAQAVLNDGGDGVGRFGYKG